MFDLFLLLESFKDSIILKLETNQSNN